MIVLPLFWDQYDNAQRIDELGFGVRLDTYRFEDGDLHSALDSLLLNRELRARMEDNGRTIRGRDGKTEAADLIEEVGRPA
jgi:UDP:flavonoid glycosyltransferase YjiC (YdhE family)